VNGGKSPEVVSQSRPGFAPHIGHGKDIALTGRISGIEALAFAIFQFRTHGWGIDTGSLEASRSAPARRSSSAQIIKAIVKKINAHQCGLVQ
jgi:hypothetical protein